jgi:argininosuccinate lyase
VVALAVRHGVEKGCDLADLSLGELQKFSAQISDDVYQVLTLEGSLASRNHIGGTAPAQVKQAIVRARKSLA